jgi:hypothetical protein
MRWSIALALVAGLLVASQSTAGGDQTPAGEKLQFNVRVFEGDPFGNREEAVGGDVRLAAPVADEIDDLVAGVVGHPAGL